MTPSNLRQSQVEVLKAVCKLGGEYGQRSLQVALELGRSQNSTERSLIHLANLGYLTRLWVGPPLSYSIFRLSPAGKAVVDRG